MDREDRVSSGPDRLEYLTLQIFARIAQIQMIVDTSFPETMLCALRKKQRCVIPAFRLGKMSANMPTFPLDISMPHPLS